MKKKFLCILLIFVMALSSFAITATAKENTGNANGTVARLYLCSNWTGFPSLGHVWIYIENLSGSTLKVGAYNLPAGQGVSVGVFALTRSDGPGIYYNVESYTAAVYGMEDALYLTTTINASQLSSISNQILLENFWDPVCFNCIFFAASCWNMSGGGFIFPLCVFPFIARFQMLAAGARSNLNMQNPGRDSVYKQKGFGSAAYLVRCSDGTVDTAPG